MSAGYAPWTSVAASFHRPSFHTVWSLPSHRPTISGTGPASAAQPAGAPAAARASAAATAGATFAR